jgi:hypothetical protein
MNEFCDFVDVIRDQLSELKVFLKHTHKIDLD